LEKSGVFIIMDKNRFNQLLESTMGNVKPLISEQVTGNTQQIEIDYYGDAFDTLYSNGYNEINKQYNGVWYQNYFTFNNYKINVSLSLLPKSNQDVTMKLELVPTSIQRMIDDEAEPEFTKKIHYDKLKNYRALVFNVYQGDKIIVEFGPKKESSYITDSNGKLVPWNTFINDVRV